MFDIYISEWAASLHLHCGYQRANADANVRVGLLLHMYVHTLALVKEGNQLSRSIKVVALTLWNTIDVCSAFKQTQNESIALPHNIQDPSV